MTLQAQVKPAHIFDNNMVLQREKPVKVWGLAAPMEKVTVEFGGQVKYTVANHLGEWRVYLDPMSANAQSVEYAAHRANLKVLRKQAMEMAGARIVREAEIILKENNK